MYYLPRGGLCTASRRRISAAEMPPSVLCRVRERSINAMNRGWVLSVAVSKSAFSTDTNAAIGFPRTVSITGSLLISRAYSASEAVASAISNVFMFTQDDYLLLRGQDAHVILNIGRAVNLVRQCTFSSVQGLVGKST